MGDKVIHTLMLVSPPYHFLVWGTYFPKSHQPKQTLPKVNFLTNKQNDFFMTINIGGGLVVSIFIPIFVLWEIG